jgi:hypothetical protein
VYTLARTRYNNVLLKLKTLSSPINASSSSTYATGDVKLDESVKELSTAEDTTTLVVLLTRALLPTLCVADTRGAVGVGWVTLTCAGRLTATHVVVVAQDTGSRVGALLLQSTVRRHGHELVGLGCAWCSSARSASG